MYLGFKDPSLKTEKQNLQVRMSSAEDDSAQLSGGGSHHEKLMHHAIDIFCSRPLRNLDAGLPRSTLLAVLLRFSFLPPSRVVSLSCGNVWSRLQAHALPAAIDCPFLKVPLLHSYVS